MRVLFTTATLTAAAALIPASGGPSPTHAECPSGARYCLTTAGQVLTPVTPGTGRDCPAPITTQAGAV